MTLPLKRDLFAVVTAAGTSRRMGGEDKLTWPLQGRPLLTHCVESLLSLRSLRGLVVTTHPGRVAEFSDLFSVHFPDTDTWSVTAGGSERQHSVRLGLEELSRRWVPEEHDVVMIQDGARPFLQHPLIERLLGALTEFDAAIPASPVRDTVKRIEGNRILKTEDRETLRLVQTPQCFPFSVALECHRRAQTEGYLGTDDASLAERYGFRVGWVEGSSVNLKVTVPEDLAILEELAKQTGQLKPAEQLAADASRRG